MRQETTLTPEEVAILEAAQDDPNIFTDYFFRPSGESKGWKFDENFTPEGCWQKIVHSAAQSDITVIGGFGTGKTLGIGMSACVWSCLATDFKFLNVAQKQWQAKQMYDLILLTSRNCRFEDLIWEKPRKPHAKLVIRFKIGKVLYESSMEFMSVDRDATGILSWEGDWINVDEAGLLDNLEEVIINVGSRMRGTVRGRERLGRFSMTSNSWDNFHMWYYFDNAVADPENFLSLMVATRQNQNVTPRQYARMLSRIPEADRERFMEGTRPEGKSVFFQKASVQACEDPYIGEIVKQKVLENTPGYMLEKARGANIVHYRVPPRTGELYIMTGDPGTDAPPRRNAFVLGVWRVTNFPREAAELVGFIWGNGNGKIQPFVNALFDLAEVYRPVKIYVDSTGPQKSTAQLINEHMFAQRFQQEVKYDLETSMGKPVENSYTEVGFVSPLGLTRGIGGLDFSGSHKMEYLQACRLFVENQLFRWPKEISGIRAQLANYDPERDKKIAQDIVAMMAMSAHAIRGYFHVDPASLMAQNSEIPDEQTQGYRRNADDARAKRSARAHIPINQTFYLPDKTELEG